MKFAALAALSLAASIALPAHAITYRVIDVGSIEPDQPTRAYAINRHGDVVGASSVNGNDHAFVVRGGALQDLGTLKTGNYSVAWGINDRGHVVGTSSTHNNTHPHAFVDRGHGMKDLGSLDGGTSGASGINNAGQIVGYAETGGWTHAVLYEGGVMKDLGTLGGGTSLGYGINDAGQTVGEADDEDIYTRAFIDTDGVMSDLGTLGGPVAYARAINSLGDVTGRASLRSGAGRAFLYHDGQMHKIGKLPGLPDCIGLALNDKAEVVGTCHESVYHPVPFVYSRGRTQDLSRLLDPVTGEGWALKEARGINHAGQIVGWGSYRGVERGFLLVPMKP